MSPQRLAARRALQLIFAGMVLDVNEEENNENDGEEIYGDDGDEEDVNETEDRDA